VRRPVRIQRRGAARHRGRFDGVGRCIISGATVRRSLLFSNVYIESHSLVEDSVILPDVAIGQRAVAQGGDRQGLCDPSDMVIGEDRHQDMHASM